MGLEFRVQGLGFRALRRLRLLQGCSLVVGRVNPAVAGFALRGWRPRDQGLSLV